MIEMVDNQAQCLLLDYRNCSVVDFAKPYCESRVPEMLSRHIPLSLFYQCMIRKLLARFRCTDLDDYLKTRAMQNQSDHLGGLFADAGIGTVLIDDSSSSTSEPHSSLLPLSLLPSAPLLAASQLAQLTNLNIKRVLAIEPVLERLFVDNDTFDQALRNLERAFDNAIDESLQGNLKVVALKTSLANGGLALEASTVASARTAYHPARKEVIDNGRLGRTASYNYLLAQVLELAVKRGLPLQIRASADQQAMLVDNNPLAFQPILRAQRFADLKVVFLHSYPFVRETAYLASVYPGVFFDLSLANSQLAPDLTRLYYEALSAAPYSKLLAGTGGNSQPESFWYGATCLRRGLSEALKELTEKGYLLKAQMEEVERAVLRSNAINLYNLH
ncbi:MAG: hypothetical protein WC028_04540 [Candidatus Obscuribacterales bacterium]